MTIEQFEEALRQETTDSPWTRLRELSDPREVTEHADPSSLWPLWTGAQEGH